MLPTEELFVYVYVLVHDLILVRGDPDPAPAGAGPGLHHAELLAIAEVRHLLGLAQRVRLPGRGRP